MIAALRTTVLALVAFAVCGGCAIFNPPYRPPVPPEASGLVIVKGEMIMPLERWGKVFAGGATEDIRPVDYGRIADEAGVSLHGRAIGGVLVFAPPQPGRYRIATLGYVQRRSVGPYPVDFEPPITVRTRQAGLAFDMRPGDVIILSKVVIRYRDATMQQDFTLESWELTPDAEGERTALAAVLTALDPESPWRAVLARRLQ